MLPFTMNVPAPDPVAANRVFYLPYFEGKSLVCDAGCGDGVFLRLLRERRIPAEGIEMNPALAGRCREQGFSCQEGKADLVLRARPLRYDAIMLSHVIEHHDTDGARGLVGATWEALKPEGRLVIVTPNPRDYHVISRDFWEDPTHVRPYTLSALNELVREAGFLVRAGGEHPRTALDDLPRAKKAFSAVCRTAWRLLGGTDRWLGDLYLVVEKGKREGQPATSFS